MQILGLFFGIGLLGTFAFAFSLGAITIAAVIYLTMKQYRAFVVCLLLLCMLIVATAWVIN